MDEDGPVLACGQEVGVDKLPRYNPHMLKLNEATFDEEVIKSDAPVIVKFHKENGCNNCAIMAPVFREFAANHPEIKCVEYALTTTDKVNSKYANGTLPIFVSFQDGLMVRSLQGMRPPADLEKMFEIVTPGGRPLSEATDAELNQIYAGVMDEMEARKKAKDGAKPRVPSKGKIG